MSGTGAPGSRRVPAPDVARGLMLWVIAVANVTVWLWDAGPLGGLRDRPLGTGASTAAWTADDAVNLALSALVDGRGFPLFSFLVGYGVGQLAAREAARGADPPAVRSVLLRRYAWLAPIGAAHAVLLFPGDIVTAYAVGGVLLAMLAHDSTRLLLALAGAGTVLTALYGAASAVAVDGRTAFPGLHAPTAAEHLAATVAEGLGVVAYAPFQLLGLLPMMLAGLALSRTRVLERPGPYRRTILLVAAVSVGAGLLTGTGTGLFTAGRIDPAPGPLALLTAADAVAGAAQGIAYALLIALVCDRVLHGAPAGPAHPVLWALQALGRRSLSGYLAQSVLFTVLMPPWALGLGEDLGPVDALLVGTCVWLLTLLAAVLLERRGRPGPAEALHRRLHLGRRVGS
ncbi:DUF418 domain-containing protein [Kocuria flava]|uniref:DUF418 domain-containing protein n=1 Tax=Kocuria flava TaxID=446860 RepID=UPI003F19F8D8